MRQVRVPLQLHTLLQLRISTFHLTCRLYASVVLAARPRIFYKEAGPNLHRLRPGVKLRQSVYLTSPQLACFTSPVPCAARRLQSRFGWWRGPGICAASQGSSLPACAADGGAVEAAGVPMGQPAGVRLVDEEEVLGAWRRAHAGAADVDVAACLQNGSAQDGATNHVDGCRGAQNYRHAARHAEYIISGSMGALVHGSHGRCNE